MSYFFCYNFGSGELMYKKNCKINPHPSPLPEKWAVSILIMKIQEECQGNFLGEGLGATPPTFSLF